MPKQTLALIVGLVLITFILFVIALKTSNPASQSNEKVQVANNISGTVNQNGDAQGARENSDDANQSSMKSVINILPKPVSLSPGQKGTVNVNIDTSDNNVTGVQLEIAYDPNVISGIDVNPAGIFSNWNVLQKLNKVSEGRYTFMLGMTPSQTPFQGNSTVATISFTALNKPGETMQLGLLPNTIVTERGNSNSVLKLAEGTLVEINTP